MASKINTEKDFNSFIEERQLAYKLREAVGFCKNMLEIQTITDRVLKYEERMNIEKCLTENYLVKKGYNYFGKRDLIYLDLYGVADM